MNGNASIITRGNAIFQHRMGIQLHKFLIHRIAQVALNTRFTSGIIGSKIEALFL
jgi:hypothetical protein